MNTEIVLIITILGILIGYPVYLGYKWSKFREEEEENEKVKSTP